MRAVRGLSARRQVQVVHGLRPGTGERGRTVAGVDDERRRLGRDVHRDRTGRRRLGDALPHLRPEPSLDVHEVVLGARAGAQHRCSRRDRHRPGEVVGSTCCSSGGRRSRATRRRSTGGAIHPAAVRPGGTGCAAPPSWRTVGVRSASSRACHRPSCSWDRHRHPTVAGRDGGHALFGGTGCGVAVVGGRGTPVAGPVALISCRRQNGQRPQSRRHGPARKAKRRTHQPHTWSSSVRLITFHKPPSTISSATNPSRSSSCPSATRRSRVRPPRAGRARSPR